MKLEIGMYVRIQWGYGEQTISKCTNKFDMGDTQYSKNDFYIHTDKKEEVIYKSMILKASFNLIDLIEVGDFVNNNRVTDVYNNEFTKQLILTDYSGTNSDSCNIVKQNEIETILTHEQYEANCYKVVE